EKGMLDRERGVGAAHDQRLAEVLEKKKAAEERKVALEKRWEQEKKLVEEIQKLRTRLEEHAAAASGSATATPRGKEKPPERLKPDEESRCRQELGEKEKELKKLQGETPLVHPVVDRQSVAEVVSAWTGIPVGKMVMDEIKTVLSLKDKLEERVIGQS